MPVTGIKEIRIFPPMAIGRFGSSPMPLENYKLEIVDPVGFRKITPVPTLTQTGLLAQFKVKQFPIRMARLRFAMKTVAFKPLCPFLRCRARFEDNGPFESLTMAHLNTLGLTPADLKWRVTFANLKPFRRTGNSADKVEADTGVFNDHASKPLVGRSRNFKQGKSIRLGTVQFLRPTDAFPEIRFRFTPPAGLVFGPRADDNLVNDDVYAGFTSTPNNSAGFGGRWDRYWAGDPNSPTVTAPQDIYQGYEIGSNTDPRRRGPKLSSGYLDDTGDGIVELFR